MEPENCLVVPPLPLVARAVHYLSLHKARATIVVRYGLRPVSGLFLQVNIGRVRKDACYECD